MPVAVDDTVRAAREPAASQATHIHPDPIVGHAIRWSHGFQLGWGSRPAPTAEPFGTT